MDFKTAVEAMRGRQATLEAVDKGVAVKQNDDPSRRRITVEVRKFLSQEISAQGSQDSEGVYRTLAGIFSTGASAAASAIWMSFLIVMC